ncbi:MULTISPECIES: hypothetical protein [Xanthomonas]|uniref:Uncharacterized protein n=1 Tax=Xanthomonas rydalmerensis TaxID=3046274 RepID=A0ABZ0JIM3_9XANT|nr:MULTISPECIES: hypothetical protein [unclassified Xanthomonas]MBB5940839.1 hypothetical protein [Xanthomonas sp. 3307]WOS39485.1 hypothetical protein QN243_13725 [Xanthomonas sp. DM-2023]WOS43669.1 hypothetical protein QN242_13725 [Xanthomonas sp. DM-2023]WOS47850.1 hypothetical protein QN240_13725 [Xanthomonas sp. DM-2023]WOS52028.1 hypothetical protein QN244_13725 [Xanthomonas sp. DM-2023]
MKRKDGIGDGRRNGVRIIDQRADRRLRGPVLEAGRGRHHVGRQSRALLRAAAHPSWSTYR